jgi:membrane associated rhomboid family serine protease
VAVYLLQMLARAGHAPHCGHRAAAMSRGQVDFHVWQVVTYGFLHGDLFHLAFNMFAVYMFGGALELVFGPKRYLNYYLVCVIAAAIVQLVFARVTGGFYPTVGASGGVFGLLLAYAIYFQEQADAAVLPC